MGVKTRFQLVEESLELAGNPQNAQRAIAWLDHWLTNVQRRYDWSHLVWWTGPYVRTLITNTLAIPPLVDGGGLTATDLVQKVLELKYADPNSTDWLPIFLTANIGITESTPASIITAQPPRAAYVEPRVLGDPYKWTIHLSNVPDREYYFVVKVKILRLPTADGDIVAYPNDETIVQALFTRALKHQDDPRANEEEAKLEAMIRSDIGTDSRAQPANPTLKLSQRFSVRRRKDDFFGPR